jgi:hypothetical protein
VQRSKTSFPPLTWVSCECGCGWEGEDDVAQFCIEEAVLITFDAMQAAALEDERAREEAEAEAQQPKPKPGEITDPVMVDAMAKVKQLHFEQTGIRVP